MAIGCAVFGFSGRCGLSVFRFLVALSVAIMLCPLARTFLVLLQITMLVLQDGERTQELSMTHISGWLGSRSGERGMGLVSGVPSRERSSGRRRHVGSGS